MKAPRLETDVGVKPRGPKGRALARGLDGRRRIQHAFMPMGDASTKGASGRPKKHLATAIVVFTPKYRKKLLFGKIKRHLGQVFHDLARRTECRIEEGHLMPDHVHMLISIPPKYAVAQVVGFIMGKSAIHLPRVYAERKRNFVAQHFGARGYFVTTVGRDEETIREHIRNQEETDARLDQMNLWKR